MIESFSLFSEYFSSKQKYAIYRLDVLIKNAVTLRWDFSFRNRTTICLGYRAKPKQKGLVISRLLDYTHFSVFLSFVTKCNSSFCSFHGGFRWFLRLIAWYKAFNLKKKSFSQKQFHFFHFFVLIIFKDSHFWNFFEFVTPWSFQHLGLQRISIGWELEK